MGIVMARILEAQKAAVEAGGSLLLRRHRAIGDAPRVLAGPADAGTRRITTIRPGACRATTDTAHNRQIPQPRSALLWQTGPSPVVPQKALPSTFSYQVQSGRCGHGMPP